MAFLRFSGLAVEIRLKIWRIICFCPREVDLWISPLEIYSSTTGPFDGDVRNRSPLDSNQPLSLYSTTTSIPPILHTNRESREVGLRHYSLNFGTDHKNPIPPRLKISAPAHIYVNKDCDVIVVFLSKDYNHDRFSYLALNRVHEMDFPILRIAVNAGVVSRMPVSKFLRDNIYTLSKVDLITLYVERGPSKRLIDPRLCSGIALVPVNWDEVESQHPTRNGHEHSLKQMMQASKDYLLRTFSFLREQHERIEHKGGLTLPRIQSDMMLDGWRQYSITVLENGLERGDGIADEYGR